jgi:SAM-dependent methyltransferase
MTLIAQIKDYDTYNSRMNKSMLDKVFFLDKIEATRFIDYGCGDGNLLNFISHHVGSDIRLLGYDNDPKMIEEAQKKDCLCHRITFTNEWNSALLGKEKEEDANALVLSSVIHEIYHYSTPNQVDEFWKRVFSGSFEYIVLRDMIPSRTIARPSDVNDVAKVYKKFLYKQELTDFENIWGSVENNKNLVHFLLKYKYLQPNWPREVRENYMPLYREDLLALLDTYKYEITYHEHYALPYIKQCVQSDMGIELKDCTHLKLILRKKT